MPELLERDATDPASSHDFGRDIIPAVPGRQPTRAPARFVFDVAGQRGLAVDSLVSGGCVLRDGFTVGVGAAHGRARLQVTGRAICRVTPAMLEGFAGAKVLVEGLRRAAARRDLTRAGLQLALESITRFDLGGLELSFSASDHTGLDYADLSIIGADGRFRR